MRVRRPRLFVCLALAASLLAATVACDDGDSRNIGDDCLDNADCDGGLFCAKADGDCDGAGTCAVRPDFCPAVFAPVCGCDGRPFDSRCVASAAGQSLRSTGPCP